MASGSGWNLWVWLLGVAVRRYIDFLILPIPTPLVSVLFCSSIPTFCSFLKCFLLFNNNNLCVRLKVDVTFTKKIVTSRSNVLHDGERSPRTRAPAELALSRRCACRQERNMSLYR